MVKRDPLEDTGRSEARYHVDRGDNWEDKLVPVDRIVVRGGGR